MPLREAGWSALLQQVHPGRLLPQVPLSLLRIPGTCERCLKLQNLRREEVFEGLAAADQLRLGPIYEHFGRTRARVVV